MKYFPSVFARGKEPRSQAENTKPRQNHHAFSLSNKAIDVQSLSSISSLLSQNPHGVSTKNRLELCFTFCTNKIWYQRHWYGFTITLQAWQVRGALSPLPAKVMEIVKDLKLLEEKKNWDLDQLHKSLWDTLLACLPMSAEKIRMVLIAKTWNNPKNVLEFKLQLLNPHCWCSQPGS